MKPDTTPVRIKNRIGEKMVQINHHRKKQNKIGLYPLLFIKEPRNYDWKNEMKKIMDTKLKHTDYCSLNNRLNHFNFVLE